MITCEKQQKAVASESEEEEEEEERKKLDSEEDSDFDSTPARKGARANGDDHPTPARSSRKRKPAAEDDAV